MILKLMTLAAAGGLLWGPNVRATCSTRLTAALLERLSERRFSGFEFDYPAYLLERLLPDEPLQVARDDQVTQLRFRLVRTLGFGDVRRVRVDALREYRRTHAWEFRHLGDPRAFALDVTSLEPGWLVELRAKSARSAERVQVFLQYSPRGVLEAVTIAPGEAPAARLAVSYPHD